MGTGTPTKEPDENRPRHEEPLVLHSNLGAATPLPTLGVEEICARATRMALATRIAALEGTRMEDVRPFDACRLCASFSDEDYALKGSPLSPSLAAFVTPIAADMFRCNGLDACSATEGGLYTHNFLWLGRHTGRPHPRVSCFSGKTPDGLNGKLAFATHVLFGEFVSCCNKNPSDQLPFDFKAWYEMYDIPAIIDFAYRAHPEYAKKVFIYFIDQLEDGKKMSMESLDTLFLGRIKGSYTERNSPDDVYGPTENLWRAILNMILLFQLLQGPRPLLFRRTCYSEKTIRVKEGGLAFRQQVNDPDHGLSREAAPNNTIFEHEPKTALGKFFDANWSADMFLLMAENQGKNTGDNMFSFLDELYPGKPCLMEASRNYQASAEARHTAYVQQVNHLMARALAAVTKVKTDADGNLGKARMFEGEKKRGLNQIIAKCDDFLQKQKREVSPTAQKEEISLFLKNLDAALEIIIKLFRKLHPHTGMSVGFLNERQTCENLQCDPPAFFV